MRRIFNLFEVAYIFTENGDLSEAAKIVNKALQEARGRSIKLSKYEMKPDPAARVLRAVLLIIASGHRNDEIGRRLKNLLDDY